MAESFEPAAPFGVAVRRREDPRLLTGRGRYVGDVELPRLLHVAFVRSPHAHARVRAIDTRAAARASGVIAIVTGRDDAIARHRIRARSALPGYVETEQPLLADSLVRHAGEAVAAVVATDRYLAEDGAALVRVDYEPLPPSSTWPTPCDRAPRWSTRRWPATST